MGMQVARRSGRHARDGRCGHIENWSGGGRRVCGGALSTPGERRLRFGGAGGCVRRGVRCASRTCVRWRRVAVGSLAWVETDGMCSRAPCACEASLWKGGCAAPRSARPVSYCGTRETRQNQNTVQKEQITSNHYSRKFLLYAREACVPRAMFSHVALATSRGGIQDARGSRSSPSICELCCVWYHD